MAARAPTVDAWFAAPRAWRDEALALRAILLGCGLAETLKWGKPAYTAEGRNLVLILPLKAACTLLFVKGALLRDPAGLLVQAGVESQSQRQMRFTSAAGIGRLAEAIRGFVAQAVQAERAGLKVAFKTSADLVYPEEFQHRLEHEPALREAFHRLTPGRQRQYHLFFTGARQPATRASRVEKAIPRILAGRGLNER